MSPEQMRGQEITPATDVYALGAILFEILAGEALHPGGAAMESTLSDAIWQPSRRVPGLSVPPELDAVCSRALLATPSERGSARELADAVQRYLDGDRDLERRRALAAEWLAAARAERDPREAVRLAGRALALDPESRDAAALVTQLILTPPEPTPPDLVTRLDEIDREDVARQGRYAMFALFGYLSFVPILAAIGITNWHLVAGAASLVVVLQIGAYAVAKRKMRGLAWAALGNAILIMMIARLTSPIILGPALAVATAAALSSFTRLRIEIIFGVMAVAIVGPMILDATGAWPPLIDYSANAITISPGAIELGPLSTPMLLGGAHLAALVIVGFVVRSLASARREAQRKVETQSWMLEQLIRVESTRTV
jgi:serine/threonine-protein kinase